MSRKEAELVEQRIREALDDLRPFLAADGGDITLDEVTADGGGGKGRLEVCGVETGGWEHEESGQAKGAPADFPGPLA